jgi:exopolysaccharide biosynthesis polyprenyl glycosylphosphotransferase
MIREKETVIRRATLAVDGMLVSLAYVLSFFLRQRLDMHFVSRLLAPPGTVQEVGGTFSEHFVFLLLIVIFWCLMLYFNGMYLPLRTRSFLETLWILIKSAFFANLGFGMFVFLFKLSFVSRIFFVIFSIMSFVFLFSEKAIIYLFMYSVRKQGLNQRRLLIVGTGRRAAGLIRKIHDHPEWGLKILGAIDDEPGRGIEFVDGVKIIGTLKEIPEILHTYAVDEVVFIVPRLRLNHIENAIRECEIEGIKVTIAVDLFDLKVAKSYQTDLEGIPLLTFKTTVPSERDLFVKRMIDFLISGACIALFSPLILIISILIKATSRGPVFFKQTRIGLNGRRFVIFKFRTMWVGAQENLSQVDIYKEIYEPKWKEKKLQYVTPIGRFLRKLSLDEFPQLFNVFWGHMSLVGPRPTLPQEVKQYEAWHRRRFSMRPGLTCLWQIKGRRNIELYEWMQLDLEYLDHWSLWLDFKILIRTVPAILFGAGAY